MITAKLIKKSISEFDETPLSTLELCYPRYIHSEFMTHRVFSRNAQSSRAIPIEKVIKTILDNPVEPIFMKNQRGMQADIPFHLDEAKEAQQAWTDAKDNAIASASHLMNMGVHKQVANRLLEPFSHIRVIVSATDWDNFFRLRIAPDAQQEICELAKSIKKAIDSEEGVPLIEGQYHLPYITDYELYESPIATPDLIKISVARCARVSYLNHDKSTPLIDKDIALHDFLLSSKHMSPLEHQATPFPGRNGNFNNWKQYRSEVT